MKRYNYVPMFVLLFLSMQALAADVTVNITIDDSITDIITQANQNLSQYAASSLCGAGATGVRAVVFTFENGVQSVTYPITGNSVSFTIPAEGQFSAGVYLMTPSGSYCPLSNYEYSEEISVPAGKTNVSYTLSYGVNPKFKQINIKHFRLVLQ